MGRLLTVLLLGVSAAAEPRIVVQSGHRGWILGADFRADGKVVAVVDRGGNVKLWDVATGKLLAGCQPSFGIGTGVAFGAGGTRLVSGTADGSVQVWDAAQGALISRYDPFERGGYCGVAVSPDGKRFAFGCDRFTAVQEFGAKEPLQRFQGPQQDRFWDVDFSPDGTLVAAASDESTVYLWRVADGKEARRLDHEEGEVVSVAFHPDGTHLLTCVREKKAHVWDWRTGTRKATFPIEGALAVRLSADGKLVAIGRTDGRVSLFGFPTEPRLELEAHADWARALAFSPDGRMLFTGGDDGRARLWDLATGEHVRDLEGATLTPLSVAETPGGAVHVVAGDRERLRVVDLVSGKEAWGMDGVAPRTRAALSPDGTHVALLEDAGVRAYPLAGGEPTAFPVRPRGAFALGPGGALLAGRMGDDEVAVWNGKARVVTLPGNRDTGILGLGFDRTGTRLAMGGKGAFRAAYAIPSGERLAYGSVSSGWIYSLGFSADGARLLAGGPYATVTLCTLDKELTPVRRMEGHVGGLHSVAFARKDSRVLSAGSEGTLRLWDAGTGAHLATVHFFEGGGWLVTALDGRYDVGGGAERFCSRVGQGLKQEPLDPDGRTPGLFASLLE